MNYNNQSTLILLFSCRCFVDCGKVVSASNKFRVTSECLNSPCIGSEYIWQFMRLNDDSKQLERIAILPNMISTAINATNMIIKKKSLQSSSKYALNLTVISPGGTAGFAVLEFETAGQPHSGYCVPSAVVGFSLETKFSFECFEWQDKNKPLSYEFRVGDEPISYGTSAKSVSTVLPSGSPENDYQLSINVIIKNAVGVAVVKKLFVKVIIKLYASEEGFSERTVKCTISTGTIKLMNPEYWENHRRRRIKRVEEGKDESTQNYKKSSFVHLVTLVTTIRFKYR